MNKSEVVEIMKSLARIELTLKGMVQTQYGDEASNKFFKEVIEKVEEGFKEYVEKQEND